MEYHRVNRAGDNTNIFTATSMQRPVAAITSRISAGTNTLKRAGNDASSTFDSGLVLFSSVIVFAPNDKFNCVYPRQLDGR